MTDWNKFWEEATEEINDMDGFQYAEWKFENFDEDDEYEYEEDEEDDEDPELYK